MLFYHYITDVFTSHCSDLIVVTIAIIIKVDVQVCVMGIGIESDTGKSSSISDQVSCVHLTLMPIDKNITLSLFSAVGEIVG